MLELNTDLLVAKGNPVGPAVIIESRAYTALMRAVRIGMPAATTGGLIGRWERLDGLEQERFIIEETEAVKLVHLGATMGPDPDEWAKLKVEVEENGVINSQIIGWYYADSDIQAMPALIDSAAVQQTLLPDAKLLLLIDPAADEGSFFLWHDGKFVPAGGFYEALQYSGAASIIPWHGKVEGAAQWVSVEAEESPGAEAPTDGEAGIGTGVENTQEKQDGWWVASEARLEQALHEATGEQIVAEKRDLPVERPVEMEGRSAPGFTPDVDEEGKGTMRRSSMGSIETQALEVIPRGERWQGELAPLFDMGQAAYERGSWVEAGKALSEVVRRDPNYIRNGHSAAEMVRMAELFHLGVAAYQRENWERARHYLREIVRLQPKSEIHKQLAAQVLAEVEEKLAGERRNRLKWVIAASVVPLLCFASIVSLLVIPAGAPLHVAVFGATSTPIAEALPLTVDNQGPDNNGSGAAKPVETPSPEEPTAVAVAVVAPSATPVPPSPTEVPRPPTATATVGPPATDVARSKVLTAVERLRMGQFEAAIENQDGSRATAQLQFDLGEGERPPGYHILTLYENRDQKYSTERISIGEEAWQRTDSGPWSEVTEQEGAWGQLQTFLPRTLSAAKPTLVETYAGDKLLRWSETSQGGEITLRFDPATGVPTEMQRLYGATGSKLTVSYIEWNTPVEIAPPAVP
jgi:hypothetical protein